MLQALLVLLLCFHRTINLWGCEHHRGVPTSS